MVRVRALGGLANRLRVVLSYRAAFGGKIECVWVPDGEIAGSMFEDVFEPIAGVTWLYRPGGEDISTTDPMRVEGLEWGDSYREIVLLPKYRARLDHVRSIHGRNASAMHVRRSDLPQPLRVPGDSFEAFAEWAKDRQPVYLATCSGEAQRALGGLGVFWLHDIPEHMHQDRFGQRNTTLADAAIDLFMCAGAKSFRGSHASSFSALALRLRSMSGWWSYAERHDDAPPPKDGAITEVTWYTRKWWRLALSRSRRGSIRLTSGTWVHLIGPLWLRTRGAERGRTQ